jgi:hypothetical protein
LLLVVAGALGLVARRQAAEASPVIPEQAIAGTQRDIETIKKGVHR